MLERLTEESGLITDLMLYEKLTERSATVLHLKENEMGIIYDHAIVLSALTNVNTYTEN
jgi:hypothetical protein